ncbi:unnamed protein product [Ectocarpus sp. CCAP 1310/34]|nr:unnamed protein product [Ectocarpus sp. CCAP 1310/34]
MRYDTQHKAGVASPQIENRRKGNSGRKGIPLEELKERLRDIPLNDRTTQRRLAAALGIPKSTLHRNLKVLGLRAHSNALKPLCNHPPNSPDTNILDLGFFASIQSLQDRYKPRTIDDLVGEAETAWEKASPDKLGKVWTSLQACLEQTLLCGGDNTYKVLPHLIEQGQGCTGGDAHPTAVPDLRGGVDQGYIVARGGRGTRRSRVERDGAGG